MPANSVVQEDLSARPAEAGADFEPWRVNIRGVEGLTGPRPASWWTGKAPEPGICPGVDQSGKIRALPLPNLKTCTRQDVLDYFDNGWTITEVLFSALNSEESFYRPPYHHLRHPMVFYYAHPAVLYINKLRVAGLVATPLDEHAEQLFATGVDEMSWDDMSKNAMRWPSLDEVRAYRSRVYETVRSVIATHPGFDSPVTMDSPLWAVAIGLEHERIHIETSSVLMREMPVNLLQRPAQWPDDYPLAAATPKPGELSANDFIDVPATAVSLGKETDFPSFGWDNEYGRRSYDVPAFSANRSLVSNGEFYQFVAEGGYQEPQWWTEDGWKWRTFRNARWPVFWTLDGPAGLHQYKLRLIFENVAMQWSWPVDVNFHEGKAFAAWRAHRDDCRYRLMTELEHVAIRDAHDRPQHDPMAAHDAVMQLRGESLAETHGRNVALAYGSSSPVTAMKPNALGFHDTFGNVWQWCEDHLAALPGFKVHRYYDDFSTPCFDGKHNVIVGGSFVSIGDEASIYARFHFRPHFTQHAGFRLVRPNPTEQRPLTSCCDAPPPYVGSGPCCSLTGERAESYDGTVMLGRYLNLHFPDPSGEWKAHAEAARLLHFAQRSAQMLTRAARELGLPLERAMDVGCAVGGASFELARSFGEVVAFDLSGPFIEAARRLQADGSLSYSIADEGELLSHLVAKVSPDLDRSRVTFRQSDACALPADLGAFQAVLAANLIDRLPSPSSFLGRLGGPRGLVAPGGVVLLTSPYTWKEAYTPREAWLGGYLEEGAELRTVDGIARALGAEFTLMEVSEMPLVIREHARKFELIFSQASLWRRQA